MTPLSISDRCHAIQQSLIDYGGPASDARERVADLTARFQLWAGNLGAFHHPSQRLSLDTRVAQSPDIRDEILRHLQEIEQASFELNAGCEASPSGEAHHDSSDRDSPLDEFGVLTQVISQSLAFLFRLAILVKAPGSESRWNRAVQRTDPFPVHFDYNHVMSKYPYMRTEKGRELATRVAHANVQRRQFIQYCRDHVGNLSSTETRPSAANDDGATERVSSKATTLPPEMSLATLSVAEFDDDNDSLMTASTTFDADTKLRLPLLSSLSPDGEAFQCPICFTIKQFDREKAWKAHAYQDLRAYSCTFGGKDCASSLFGNRKSWFDHEITQHRSQFTCTLCNKPCKDKGATVAHISHSHGIALPEQLSMLADSGRIVPTHFTASDCPFCDWSLERRRKRSKVAARASEVETVSRAELKRHIAMHQEQLVLFVAPLPDASENEDVHSDVNGGIGSERSTTTPDLQSLPEVEPPHNPQLSSWPIQIQQDNGRPDPSPPPPPPLPEPTSVGLGFRAPPDPNKDEASLATTPTGWMQRLRQGVGSFVSTREPDRSNKSKFQHGRAMNFPEIPGEAIRNADLKQFRGQWNQSRDTDEDMSPTPLPRSRSRTEVFTSKSPGHDTAGDIASSSLAPSGGVQSSSRPPREGDEDTDDKILRGGASINMKEKRTGKEVPPVRFKDAVGRKFSFPFHLCQTWTGMDQLIQDAFRHVDVIGPRVEAGHYDILDPDGEVILPQAWEEVIKPDMSITMHMWSLDREPGLGKKDMKTNKEGAVGESPKQSYSPPEPEENSGIALVIGQTAASKRRGEGT